jgi:hypothetical protein
MVQPDCSRAPARFVLFTAALLAAASSTPAINFSEGVLASFDPFQICLELY